MNMSVLIKVENVSSNKIIEMSRVPCVGEFIYVDDEHVEVKTVYHTPQEKDYVAKIIAW
jgi:hypothetical protein